MKLPHYLAFGLRSLNVGLLLCGFWMLFLSVWGKMGEGPLTPVHVNGLGMNSVITRLAFWGVPAKELVIVSWLTLPFIFLAGLFFARFNNGKQSQPFSVKALLWLLLLVALQVVGFVIGPIASSMRATY